VSCKAPCPLTKTTTDLAVFVLLVSFVWRRCTRSRSPQIHHVSLLHATIRRTILTFPVDGVTTAIWSGIEINVAIICASIPALKPLISKLLPGLLSNASSRDRSNMNNLSEAPYNRSHPMSNLRSKSRPEKQDIIKVEQTIYQAREVRASAEGSERSLVNWKSDCYSEEQKKKQIPVDVVWCISFSSRWRRATKTLMFQSYDLQIKVLYNWSFWSLGQVYLDPYRNEMISMLILLNSWDLTA